MSVLSMAERAKVAACLVDGTSIRATERITGAHRDTVMRFGIVIGEGCARLHDRLVRAVPCHLLQCDEAWTFVHTKEKRVVPSNPAEWGDQYVYVGLDVPSRAILSYLVGKRDAAHALRFALDLRARTVGRPQISTDGWGPYPEAIWQAYGYEVDFGQVVKDYRHGASRGPDHRVVAYLGHSRKVARSNLVDTSRRLVGLRRRIDGHPHPALRQRLAKPAQVSAQKRAQIGHVVVQMVDAALRALGRARHDGRRIGACLLDLVVQSHCQLRCKTSHFHPKRATTDHRYEPPREPFITRTVVAGKPYAPNISTSLVERQNLQLRSCIKRMARLTNAYSKKKRNLDAAVALHVFWYNYGTIHGTLRTTPAMAAGLTRHVWSLEEMIAEALAVADEPPPVPMAPPPPPVAPPPPVRWQQPEQLGLFDRVANGPAVSKTEPVTRGHLRLIRGGLS
jgi:IS1 family transposase